MNNKAKWSQQWEDLGLTLDETTASRGGDIKLIADSRVVSIEGLIILLLSHGEGFKNKKKAEGDIWWQGALAFLQALVNAAGVEDCEPLDFEIEGNKF